MRFIPRGHNLIVVRHQHARVRCCALRPTLRPQHSPSDLPESIIRGGGLRSSRRRRQSVPACPREQNMGHMSPPLRPFVAESIFNKQSLLNRGRTAHLQVREPRLERIARILLGWSRGGVNVGKALGGPSRPRARVFHACQRLYIPLRE
jgi:hypothetical protein